MEEIINIWQHKHKKLRILCFHGYYNNIDVMKHQFGYYEHIFHDYVEFIYINGFYENTDVFDFSLYKMFKDHAFYSWAIVNDRNGKPQGLLNSLKYVIDYMNKTGPYDGLLGFSQGTFLVRTLLKLKEFKTQFPELKHIPEFGIIVSGPLRLSVNIFNEYPQDKYKLLTAFRQPILYLYGTKDIYLDKIEFGVIEEGDYTIIKHNAGHNVPKLVGEEMEVFIRFIERMYHNKFEEELVISIPIDSEFKQNYISLQKQKLQSKL
jgi:predicted secreted protein